MKISKLSLAALSALCATTALNAQLLDLTGTKTSDNRFWSYISPSEIIQEHIWVLDLGQSYELFGISRDELFESVPLMNVGQLRLSVYDDDLRTVFESSIDASGLTTIFPRGISGRWVEFSLAGENSDVASKVEELKVFGYLEEDKVSVLNDVDASGGNLHGEGHSAFLDAVNIGAIVSGDAAVESNQEQPESSFSGDTIMPMSAQSADDSMTINYEYNARGELIKVSSGSQTRAIEYDQRGNIKKM